MTTRHGTRAAVHCLLGIILLTTATAGDWPRFLGPNGDSKSSDTGINKDWGKTQPKELWRVAMSDAGYSGPSVAQGLLYINDHKGDDEIVRAIELETGTEKWRHTFPEPGKQNMGFTRATPTVDDGVVYAVSRYGTVTALDAVSGEKKWSANPVSAHGGSLPRWEIASSAVIDGDHLIAIAGADKAHLVALSKATGDDVWAGGGTEKPGYATPVIATLGGIKQYLVFRGKSLVGVDTTGGDVLWEHAWGTKYDVNAPAPIALDGDRILLASGYHGRMALLKLEGKALTTLWENKEVSLKWNSAVIVDEHIYATIEPGFLACLELETGTEKWRSKGDTKGFEYGGLCFVDGTLIVVSGNTGSVVQVAVDPAGYKELGRMNPLNSAKCWTAPVVADKKLIVRSPAELVCLDLAQ